MKLLTKKWAEQYEQVKVIHDLKEFDAQKESFSSVEKKSKEDFYHKIKTDAELSKVALKTNTEEKLYQALIERNRKIFLSLPKEIYSGIKDIKTIILGYANKEDKEFLTDFAIKKTKELETLGIFANERTEMAQSYLLEEFILDDFIGELVYEEFSNGKDYFIKIGGNKVCIENYQILEREDNHLTSCTSLLAGELYHTNNCFELHLLLVNEDKYLNDKYWYFTLKGNNIKIQ